MYEAIFAEKQKLRERLQGISFRSRRIPEEELKNHQRIVAMLILKLDHLEVSSCVDTRNIDGALYKICDELENVYRMGDVDTANHIKETLIYGIVTGHCPLKEAELKIQDQILKLREKMLQTHIKVSEISQHVFQCKVSDEKTLERLQKNEEQLEKLQREIEEALQKNACSEAQEMMRRMQSSEIAEKELENIRDDIEKMIGKQENLAEWNVSLFQKIQRVFLLKYECRLLHKQLQFTQKDILDCESLISMLQMSLTMPLDIPKEELKEHVRSLVADLNEWLEKHEETQF